MARVGEQLQKLLQPVVTGLGYEWVGAEYNPTGTGGVLRVYIDTEAGINVDDCAAVSRQLAAMLDVEDPIPGAYQLEVSSPGLERPLFELEDFARFAGERVQMQLLSKHEGRKRLSGVLLATDADGNVTVEEESGPVTVPFELIDKARLKPEY